MKTTRSLLLPLLLALALLLPLLSAALLSAASSAPEEPQTWTLNGVNTVCRTGFAVVYTEAGTQTGTDEKCVDVRVGNDGIILSVEANDATVPENGFVLSGSGVKAKTLKTLVPGDGVLFTRNADGSGGTVTLVTKAYSPFSESTVSYNGRNNTRSANTIILYDVGANTKTNEWGFEVSVDQDGTVVAVGGNNSPIPEGGFVLSGHGEGKTALENAAALGMRVTLDTDNKTATFRVDAESYANAYALRLAGYKDRFAEAKDRCLVLDEDAVNASLARLGDRQKEIENALKEGNNVLLYLKEAAFGEEADALSALLTERTPSELRGVWIRPDLTTDKDAIGKTVRSIYEAGFNQVYIEILFDSTLIYPPAEGSLYEQNPKLNGFDLLQAYIEACHAYRIELHAWYSVMRVGHTGSSNTVRGVGAKKPEWRNIQKNGKDTVTNTYGTAYFLNPALPEVRTFLVDHVKDLVSRYALDGLHLDYIRYPNNEGGEDFGYDETTCKLYKEQTGTDPKTLSTGDSSFVQFRADFITQIVREIRTETKKLRPDLWLSAAVAPNYANSLRTHQQDTRAWIRDKLIDIVMPMAYGTTSVVTSNTKDNAKLLREDAALYLLPGVTDYGADTFIEQTNAARANGSDGIAFFAWSSYANGYGKASSVLFSDPATPPTWSTLDAMRSRTALLAQRLEGPLKGVACDGLRTAVDALRTKLETSPVSACGEEIDRVLSAYESERNLLPENAQSTVDADVYALRTMRNLDRDDAKKAYLETHPLPESRIPSGTSEDGSEAGTEGSGAEESAPDKTVPLNTFEQIMQVAAMVILIGGVLLLPLYYVLYRRRKKIIRSFSEEKEPENEDPENAERQKDPEDPEKPEDPDNKA